MSVQDGTVVRAATDVSVEVDATRAPPESTAHPSPYRPAVDGLTQRRARGHESDDADGPVAGFESGATVPGDGLPMSEGFLDGWLGQVNALTRKNIHLLWGRKLKTLTILVLPSVFVICVAVLQHAVQINSGADDPTAGSLAALEVGGAILSVGAILNTIIQINLICSEKQQGLTAFMRMVGMHESAYWWSNILAFSLTSAVSAALMVIVGLFTQVAPFTAGSFSVLWTLYFLFFLAQSASACFVSSFLCRPTWINLFSFLYFGFASATSFVENLYPFIVDICYMDREGTEVVPNTWNWLTILILPLMPWLSFARAFDEYARQTTVVGGSFTWSDLVGPGTAYPPGMFGGGPNANQPGHPQSAGFTAPSGMVSVVTLLLAVPWLTMLAWWSAQVYGGETRKRFFFPLQPSYWGCGQEQHEVASGDAIGRQKLLSKHERSVRIHKLSKSFKTVSALKELTLTMERNRIFCLLGHNGAGKTTLLNTLTGLHDPTFGEAFVCGHSIRTEMPAIQRLMGICPQHDVLWDNLTAQQTLEFYARFKGVRGSKLVRYIDNAIAQFGLHDEANRKVGTFSGGMKRRLSVAVSAMGDPLVCYLDEPSTGMDALHRRQVWNVIQELRKDRLVVLTTHSMEEADVLSDTIAIMANGVLKAAGTSLFLKNRYGRGYQLKLISCPEDSMQTEALVEKHLNGAEFLATSAGNLSVSLGRHLGPRVARFFRELETGELSQLVTEWEISNTSLEQVFLRLCGLTSNANINQGGVEDVYAQQTDPTKFRALDVVDTCNAVRWAQSNSTPKPVFSAVDEVVEVALGQDSIVLGHVPADTDDAQLADKYLGTMRKPLEAVPVGDGRGSLSILLPVNGIPGSKMCVRIPDLRVVTVEVPLDATPGSAMRFVAAPATDDARCIADTTAAGLPQLQHRSAKITCLGQAHAIVRKNWRMQAKQRKASCCQCCILVFFALFMFGLAPHPAPNANPQDQLYTVVNFTAVSQPWQDVNATAAPPDSPTTTTGASAQAVGGSTLIMSLITTFNLPKLVHEVVNEKQQRLYHSMRLQGLRLWSYWFGFWLWSLALQASICVPMVLAGYVLGVQVYKHLHFFEYVGILVAWAHSQAGLAAFGGCFFRSSKIASIMFYLLLVGSALTVTIINQLAFLEYWPSLLLLFPLFSFERALALMLMGDQAPAGALVEAVSYNLASGTALLALGVVLHLIIPNEFGLSESQVLVDWCCRKPKLNQPQLLDEPLLRHANDELDEILGDDIATEKHDVQSHPPADSAVVFKGLQLRYSLGLVEEFFRCVRRLLGGAEKRTPGDGYAISDLSFRIKSAEFFGLLGPVRVPLAHLAVLRRHLPYIHSHTRYCWYFCLIEWGRENIDD